MRDLLSYPMPVGERISFLYFDKAVIERDGHALVCIRGSERVVIPVGRMAVILLGPGASVSHAAIALCALEGAILLWVGEAGVRLYSAGNPRSNSSAILRQAALRIDSEARLEVARRIYQIMFDESAPLRRSIDQLRGIEGGKVKAIYQSLGREWGVNWIGRCQTMDDPINAAVSTATSALYGLAEAVILALGYSPAIGFIHDGDPRSFVFDIADTVKFKSVVPLAFQLVAEGSHLVEQRTRAACRDLFFQERIAEKLVGIVLEVLGADGADRSAGC